MNLKISGYLLDVDSTHSNNLFKNYETPKTLQIWRFRKPGFNPKPTGYGFFKNPGFSPVVCVVCDSYRQCKAKQLLTMMTLSATAQACVLPAPMESRPMYEVVIVL